MNKSAILHIPMSQYAYGTDEEHVTIRLRTAKDDIKRCRLYFGDRACRLTPVIFTEAEMHVVAGSELFEYYEVKMVGAIISGWKVGRKKSIITETASVQNWWMTAPNITSFLLITEQTS